MILIAYDGSTDARAAIEHAASLMPEQSATVLTVWDPYIQILSSYPTPFGVPMTVDDSADADAAARTAAEERASEGAALARSRGIVAHPATASRGDSVASTVLAEADRVNAGAIVVGCRGLGRVGSLLLGSVSHSVIQHADRPVVIVPSPKVALRRNEHQRAVHPATA